MFLGVGRWNLWKWVKLEEYLIVFNEMCIVKNFIKINLFIGNEILEVKILFILICEGLKDMEILDICV